MLYSRFLLVIYFIYGSVYILILSLSHVWLFATPWTVAHQDSPSMGFSRQEYWNQLPFPSPGDLPDPGIEPGSPTLQADALLSEPPGKPHYRELECKSRKSRNTWSNRQIWPWSTEWSRQRLIEFCQENALVIANTLFQQHKRRLYTWTSPDGQYRNQIDYILCSQRWRSSIQLAKTRLGADCGSDH